MQLPRLEDLDVYGKNVILRLDLDVPVEDGKVVDDTRLRKAVPTIGYLQSKGAYKITIIGHRGRPDGSPSTSTSLSLRPVAQKLEEVLREELGRRAEAIGFFVLENLRFNAGEIPDSAGHTEKSRELAKELARELARDQDFYVNDAFATSHEEAASIVELPKLLPHAAGLHLRGEVENLEKVINNQEHPSVFILGGGKLDKVLYIDKLLDRVDTILVGGILPKKVSSYCRDDEKMCVVAAHLTRGGEDITPDSVRNFVEVIKKAKLIVWNGPLGDINKGFWDGTHAIADALAKSSAYKVVGGGDTLRALQKFGVLEKMNYVSLGGGAMLEFLAYGDLPGLRALRE